MSLSRGRLVRSVLVAGAVILLAIQLVPVERANPPADPARALAAHPKLPPGVLASLDRACRDCHSHATRWPWYSHVAPTSWLMADHVKEGRSHLNFSEWVSYDARDMSGKLEEICEETREGKMPLKSYLLLHPRARLTSAEIDGICAWTTAARSALGQTESHERAVDREGR